MAAHTAFEMMKLDKNYLSDFLLHRISALYVAAGSHVVQFFQYSAGQHSVEFELFSDSACLESIKLHTCTWTENIFKPLGRCCAHQNKMPFGHATLSILVCHIIHPVMCIPHVHTFCARERLSGVAKGVNCR